MTSEDDATTSPNFEGAVQECLRAFEEEERRLEAEEAKADERLRTIEGERAAAEAQEANHSRGLAVSQTALASVNAEIKTAPQKCTLAVMDSFDGDRMDFEPMARLRDLMARRDDILTFIKHAMHLVLEAKDLRLNYQASEKAAQGDLIDCRRRKLQAKSRRQLAPLVAQEGEVRIDSSVGVSAELARMAQDLRVQAAGYQTEIDEVRRQLRTLA
jgi:hypothetical protein